MNVASSTPVTTASDDEINLGQLFGTIWRGKFWIALTAIIGVVLGGYYVFVVAVPVYTTTTTIVQETDQQPVVDFSGGLGGGFGAGDLSAINTEIEVLQSRGIIEKLVVELDLLSDPEFNEELQPAPLVSIGIVRDMIRTQLDLPLTPAPELSEQAILDQVVDNVNNALLITNLRQSYVYSLTATSQSPVKSALITNTLADIYIDNQLDVKSEANLAATEWLTNRVSQLRSDLENAESAVKDFNAGSDLINVDTLAAISRQVKELRDRLENVSIAKTDTLARLAELQATVTSDDVQLMASVADDRILNEILTSLAVNPAINRSFFDSRYQQVIDLTAQEATRLDDQIATLQRSISQQESAIDQQSNDLIQLQQLEREAEASRLLYEYFLSRLKETAVQSGIQTPDSRVLSRAVVPLTPSAPRKAVILALSLLFGIAVGMLFVLLREMTQNTFRSAEDLESKTNQKILGQIPMIAARKRNKVLKYLTDNPSSVAAEAIRNMRTSLLLSDIDNPPQVIMSTSSVPGEGKTTQSLALAQNLAGLGKKVLLVEGDVRKRVFAEYFDIKDDKGLMAVLKGDIKLEDATVYQQSLQADVLMSESPQGNAADVFSSQAFKDFMKSVRQSYDYIVIDTPPVLAVPDARIIGRLVDATVYTVRWDHTKKRQVEAGIKALETVNIKITGLVLGQINLRGLKKYGYGDAYGNYSSYHSN